MKQKSVFLKMFLQICLLILCSVAVPSYCNSQLLITDTTSSVEFGSKDSTVSASDVPTIVQQVLGLTVPLGTAWSGVKSVSPFNVPKSAVIFEIHSNEPIEIDMPSSHAYSFDWNQDLKESYKVLSCVFNDKFQNQVQDIALFNKDDIEIFESDHSELTAAMASNKLDSTIDSVVTKSQIQITDQVSSLLTEVNYLVKLSKQIEKKAQNHGLYVFRINAFQSIADAEQKRKAAHVLNEALKQVIESMKKAYDNKVVVFTALVDETKVRKARNILAASSTAKTNAAKTTAAKTTAAKTTAAKTTSAKPTATPTPGPGTNKLNLAKQYSSDYQNTFAAVLFLLIVLIFSTLAISVIMWNMDPGRDSIIYRMTSQRVKID